MKYLFVYNPYSRYGLKEKEIKFIKNKFIDDEVSFYKSEYQGSIEKYVIQNGNQYDVLVVCGAIKLENPKTIALLPKGTMNDVAKSLGYSFNLNKSLNIILKGNSLNRDVYSIGDTFFLYGMAIGRYSNVSYEAKNKRRFGIFSYYIFCLKEFFKSRPTVCKVNGKSLKINQLFIINNDYMAGYKMEFLNDHRIHLKYNLAKNRFIDTFKFLFFLLSKGKRHIKEETYDSLTIEGNNLKFTLDGEKYESNKVLISILDLKVKIICK